MKKLFNRWWRSMFPHYILEEIKNMYKARAQTRRELIKKVMELKTGSNLAEMEKETILNLKKMK